MLPPLPPMEPLLPPVTDKLSCPAPVPILTVLTLFPLNDPVIDPPLAFPAPLAETWNGPSAAANAVSEVPVMLMDPPANPVALLGLPPLAEMVVEPNKTGPVLVMLIVPPMPPPPPAVALALICSPLEKIKPPDPAAIEMVPAFPEIEPPSAVTGTLMPFTDALAPNTNALALDSLIVSLPALPMGAALTLKALGVTLESNMNT